MLEEQLLGFFSELERINQRFEEATQLFTGQNGEVDGLLTARHDLDKLTLQMEDLIQLKNMIDSLRSEVEDLWARISQVTEKLAPEAQVKLMQKIL